MTFITENHPKKLPPLPCYADHVDRILARPSRPRRPYLLACLPVLLALWLWPGWVLTLALLGAGGLLAWFLWSARAESREYNTEHDLPDRPKN